MSTDRADTPRSCPSCGSESFAMMLCLIRHPNGMHLDHDSPHEFCKDRWHRTKLPAAPAAPTPQSEPLCNRHIEYKPGGGEIICSKPAGHFGFCLPSDAAPTPQEHHKPCGSPTCVACSVKHVPPAPAKEPILTVQFTDDKGMLLHGLEDCVREHDANCKVDVCACPHSSIAGARFLINAYAAVPSVPVKEPQMPVLGFCQRGLDTSTFHASPHPSTEFCINWQSAVPSAPVERIETMPMKPGEEAGKEAHPKEFKQAVCTLGYRSCDYDQDGHIHTLEGVMNVSPEDWIIKGVSGEFYPCKPDIFAKSYEPAAAPSGAEEATPGGPLCDNCGHPSRHHYCYVGGPETYHPSESRHRKAGAALPVPEPPTMQPSIRIEVFQKDWMPGFASFLDDGAVVEGAPVHIALNLGSLLCAVQSGDLAKRDLPYFIAETLMHETIHALEAWAQVEFSEDRVEELLTQYRDKYGRNTIWEYDSAAPPRAVPEPRPEPPCRDIHTKTQPVMVVVDVDAGIASLVAKLNTIPHVRTHSSCQGTIGEGGAQPYGPYVDVSWQTPAAKKELEARFNLEVKGQAWGTVAGELKERGEQ